MEPLTRPPVFHHRRKHSTASSSSNGMAFSGKLDYKELFNGGHRKTKFRRGMAVEDYNEIFASSGCGSTIPVLDLSELERANGSGEVRGSIEGHLDYSRIFGGSGSAGAAGRGVPPYEELLGGADKSKSDKAKPRVTAELGSPMKESDTVQEYGIGRGCLPSNQSFDGAKQLNVSYHKTSQRGKQDSNGTTHIAQLNAVSGFTCFVNGDTRLQNQDHDKGTRPEETETNDKRNTSDELSDGKSGRRAKWRLQNKQQASDETVDGKNDVDRNLTGLNRTLFHSGEIDIKPLKAPPPSSSPIDQSCPKEKLFYTGELELKSPPSKVPPPSGSSVQHNDNKMHLNQSKSFAFGSKVDSPKKDDVSGYFTPSDEELDADSAAAVSAAALKKAIQQAQESIRLAKEIMERKHNRMKRRSRNALKVKDVKENMHNQHVVSVAENIEDVCNVLETKAQVQTEYDQNKVEGNVEVISAVKEREAFPVNRIAEAQKPEERAETVGGGVSLWFTQLLNNGKNRMSAFASQLGDNNNTILPEKSEKIEEAEITKATVTFEMTKSDKMAPKIAERELSTFHRETYPDMNVDICETDVFVKDSNLNEQVHDKFEEGGKSEKRLKCQEIKDDKKLESEEYEKDRPAKKIIFLEERTDESEMVFKLEKEEVLDAVFGLEENERRIDAVDGRKLGEFSQVVDNDGQPKAANVKEIFKKLEDLAEVGLECNSQHKTDEQMPIDSHGGAGNQILSPEACFQKELDPRTISKRQYEGKYLGHRDVIVSIQQQEIDLNKTCSWPEDANKNHLNSSFDSCDSDNINMPSENIELCGLSMNFCNEQVSQLDQSSVNDNNLAGDEEQVCELEGKNIEQNDDVEFEEDGYEIEQEVEGPFWLEESEICETSCLNEGGEGDVLDASGRNTEGGDFECEEDAEQVEQAVEDALRLKKREFCEASYLDGNNEDGDLLQTLGRENEAIDDLEREVDEEEVEQVVDGAFSLKQNEKYKMHNLDQCSVQGDVLETIVQHVSDAHVSGDKTDSLGSVTTTHEEIICEGELPTDFDLLKIKTFIHIDTEEFEVDDDRDKEKSSPEKSPPTFGFSDRKVRIQIKEENGHSDFLVGPENITVVHENEVCIGNIMQDNVAPEKEAEMDNQVEDHQERDMFEKYEKPDSPTRNNCEGCREHLETDSVSKTGQSTEGCEKSFDRTEKESIETREAAQKETETETIGYKNDYLRKIELVKRERERQKDRIAVERAIREARERAFVEARERAERAIVEKANADVRQRAMAEAWEKLGKMASGTKISSDKAFSQSKLKAERSAVERATAEARERALEKAMSRKSSSETKAPGGKVGAGKSPSVSTNTGLKHSVSSPNLEGSGESNTESAQRRKARMERHQRIMERSEKALAEKNMRDVLAQREQAERNRLAETLDAEIKRWASGKEGNLRALLSTLQYILGSKCGWQPITLTEIITTTAVKKAYRKATLYVHPDKLQQRGASIQQKYICEKVFDLLQAAWNKLNSEER